MEAPREAERARVLIVDDHEDNIELLRARLEAWGFDAVSASDGEEALQRIDECAPDLILLDVMMPKIDGIEVAKRVKGNRSLPFIPIIMQTALDATENKVEGLEAGADDYITKPIDFAELKARVNSMLRIKRLQDALEERERQLLEANERLRHMSQTDALTGLDNRRHLEERLEEMFEHARRLNEPFACVMCDLDRFKSVNDTYGHQAGDADGKLRSLRLAAPAHWQHGRVGACRRRRAVRREGDGPKPGRSLRQRRIQRAPRGGRWTRPTHKRRYHQRPRRG